MQEEFYTKMKDYAESKDIPFSSLIRSALRLYTNDENDCFVELAKQYSGSEAADKAADAMNRHNIKQSHFLGHIIKESASALSSLKEGQDWHTIKCQIETYSNTNGIDPEVKKAIDLIRSDLQEVKQKVS